jgi:hypothetical protein
MVVSGHLNHAPDALAGEPLPGPSPTPVLSPIPGGTVPPADEGELNGIGGGPMTCDTRREAAGEFEMDCGAADGPGGGRGSGDGGSEFRSGAMMD